MNPDTEMNAAQFLHRRRFSSTIRSWHAKNRHPFPWRIKRTPYRVLLSELLLQRTPADRVARHFDRIASVLPDPQAFLTLSDAFLSQALAPLGLKKRTRWLTATMRTIATRYRGSIPSDLKALRSLPGVGHYTAHAVACFGFGAHVPMLDGNIARLLRRYFGLPDTGKRPSEDQKLWSFVTTLLPNDNARDFNEGLIDFAMQVCAPKPHCQTCPLQSSCRYADRGLLQK